VISCGKDRLGLEQQNTQFGVGLLYGAAWILSIVKYLLKKKLLRRNPNAISCVLPERAVGGEREVPKPTETWAGIHEIADPDATRVFFKNFEGFHSEIALYSVTTNLIAPRGKMIELHAYAN
jgi:hypothetical protein